MRFVNAYSALFFAVIAAFRAPQVQALMMVCTLIALLQSALFMLVEDWRFLDAFYFSVVSMATVGYGDLTPETPLGKFSSMVFLLVGVGVFVITVAAIAQVILHELALVESEDSDATPPDQKGEKAPPSPRDSKQGGC